MTFVPVMQEDDCSALQSLLNSLSSWCASNFLELCPSKCSVISFCRRHSPLIHNYVLSNTVINRVSCVRDLGIMLDERQSFDSHLELVIGKAYSNLGLIFRMTLGFTAAYFPFTMDVHAVTSFSISC